MFSTATATRTNQFQSNTNVDTSGESGKALVVRPKGRGPGAKRELYDDHSAQYMTDLRPNHEQTNTLLGRIGAESIDKQCKNAKGATKRKRANQSDQKKPGHGEMFPALGSPVKSMPVKWVTQSKITTDAFTGTLAPVPASKKVANKPKMQVLSKATTNYAVNNLNFQEEKVKLLADIERWQQVADERGQMLDDMEWEIGRLKRELDDAYDRCQ